MKKLIFSALLLLVSISFSDVSNADSSLEKVKRKFSDMVASGGENYGTIFSEDATIYPPNQRGIHQIDGINEFFSNMIQLGLEKMELSEDELLTYEDTAYEYGRHSSVLDVGQEKIELAGNYHIGWILKEDEWRFDRLIWTSYQLEEN